MIEIVKSEARGLSQWDWLKSYHSFSFNEFYDPKITRFDPLRVLNEDWIDAANGFGMHPHRDMEIITYVLEGTLEHQDSTGSHGTIVAGEVQRMTAGSGIFHSEMNSSTTEEVHLLQIWFHPDHDGYEPSYEQKQFAPEERHNTLLHVASNTKETRGVFLNQDVNMFISRLDKKKTLSHTIEEGRGAYLFLIEGALKVGSHSLKTGDALQVDEAISLDVHSEEDSEFVLFDMKM